MKRALKFLTVFLGTAVVIIGFIIGINYPAFKTLFSNSDGMAEGSEYVKNTYSLKDLTVFIGEKPEFISIVSFDVNNPDSGIFYQPDISRSMGTTANIFLLIEYERQVAAGKIDPNESIPYAEIQRLALPEISEKAHEESFSVLKEKNADSVLLDKAVAAMIEYNDLAIADFLWFKLGQNNLMALMDTLDLSNTSLPLPFSGYYIYIHPDFDDTSNNEAINSIITQANRYKNDDDYNKTVKTAFREDRLSRSFIEERNLLKFAPQTTARDMAKLVFGLYHETLLSPKISRAVKEKLRWPMGSSPIERSFKDYGAIYDNRMGLLCGIDFGTSIYDGHTSVQAVYFDRLPVAFWLHMSANHMQEDYQQRLIWDPALYETTQKAISK